MAVGLFVSLPYICVNGSVSDQSADHLKSRRDQIRNGLDYTGVCDTPLVLAVALALLAVATLTHVLLTSVRRRRDLAMFKTLGMLHRQVLSLVL